MLESEIRHEIIDPCYESLARRSSGIYSHDRQSMRFLSLHIQGFTLADEEPIERLIEEITPLVYERDEPFRLATYQPYLKRCLEERGIKRERDPVEIDLESLRLAQQKKAEQKAQGDAIRAEHGFFPVVPESLDSRAME